MLNAWCRSLALLGLVLVACGGPTENSAPTEALGKVQEAVVDENAALAPGEVRGARTRSLTFWAWNHADPIASSELVPVPEVASGGGRIFNSTAYPAGTYWIAAKHSPNQGEWVTHLIKSKAPPPGGLSDGNALWLTHSQFFPTGQAGPGGVTASDPPGLVNGVGFVQPSPSGGALSTPVVSGPGSGVNGTRHNWTSGPADTGAAVRVRDDNLMRIPFVTNQIVRQSFLTQAVAYVPSHPERAGGTSVGNSLRYLLFLQRGGVNLASGGTIPTAPIDFSTALDQWKWLHIRTDITTSGGSVEGSSDDWARVKYRIYLDGQLVSTQEPPLDAAVLQGQMGPVTTGPGFAVLRGWQGDAPEAFIDSLDNYAIAPPTPLAAGESAGTALWNETFGTPGDGAGSALSASRFVPYNSNPDRSMRLFDASGTQLSGTTAIAYKGSSATPARITQHYGHYAPGAACSTNATTPDCRLPSGGTFDGTAMWVSHSRFVPANGSVGPPAVGSDSPTAVGRRTDGSDATADTGAYVRLKDEHLLHIPFTDGRSERRSYLISADVYVPYHVGGHEWVRVAPFVRRGTQVQPSESAFEIGLLGLTNRWFRMTVRADVTTHAGGPGTADDKAEVFFHYAYDGTSINWAPFGGAYVNLDNIAKLGAGDLEFGISYGVALGWQLDALETFIDNVTVQPIGQGHALCAIDTDCPTGQICTDESARVGLPSGTKFCWDMACGTSSSSMCGSTSSPCGLCPDGAPCASSDNCTTGTSCTGGVCSCGATCVGKACGASDGCGGTCYCGIGQTSCTSETPCETGFVCQSPTCGYTPIQSVALRPGEVRLAERLIHLGASGPDAWDLTPYYFINHAAFGSGTSVRYSGNPVSGYRIAYKNHANRGDWVSHHLTPSPPPLGLPIQFGWYSHAAVWLSHSRFQSGATPAIGEVSPEQTGTPWIGGAAVSADRGTAVRFDDMASHRVPIVANQTTLKSFLIMSSIYVPAHAGARYGVRVSPYLARGGAPLTPLGGVGPRAIDFTNKHAAWNLVQVRADVSTHGGSTDGPTDDTMRVTNRFYVNGEEVGVPEVVDVSTDVLASHHGPVVISPSFGLSRGWEGDAPEAYIVVARIFELGHGARLAAGETLGAPLYTLTFNNTPESSSLTGTGILDRGFRGYGATSLRLFDGTNTQRSGRYVSAYKNSPQAGDWISHHFRTLVPSEDTLLRSGSLFDGTAMWLGHSRFLPSGEVVSTTPPVTSVGPPAIGLQSAPATGTRWNGTVGTAEWGGNDARVTNDLMALATVPFTAGVTRRQSYLISMDLFVPKHVGAHASSGVQTPALIRRGDHNHQRSESLNFGALLDRWNRVDVRVDVPTHGSNGTDLAHDLAERDVQYFVNGKLMEGVSDQLDDGFLGLAPGQPLTVGPAFALSHGWFGAPPEAYVDNITMRPITSGPTACTSDAQCLEGGRVCLGGSCKDPACGRPNAPCRVCGPCGAGTACTGPDGCDPGFACTNGTCECVPQCAGKGCGADDGCGGTCDCGSGEDGCQIDEHCNAGLTCLGGTCSPPGCRVNPVVFGCGYLGAPCGPDCTRNPQCEDDEDCPTGLVCPENNGWRYGLPQGTSVCERTDCPNAGCGTPASECGMCPVCEPSCAGKSCGDADLSDGCGGRCAALCADGESGCSFHTDCLEGSLCLSGVCRPADCTSSTLAPPDCGTTTAICGPICPTPDVATSCEGRECGPDPAYGGNCGACDPGEMCNTAGRCVSSPEAPSVTVQNPNGTSRDVTPAPSPPAVALGAIAGAFAVSDHGTATYTIPIEVPPGRAGIQPSLALVYDSTTTNGIMGVGWSLTGLSSIKRCARTFAQDGITRPVRGWLDGAPAQSAGVDERDAFCLDGQRLVRLADGSYRTSIDTFAKIVPQVDNNLIKAWRVHAKDGTVMTYGAAVRHRHGDSHTWALTELKDIPGNTMRVTYGRVPFQEEALSVFGVDLTPTGELLPRVITYTGYGTTDGDREVIFNYDDDRSDTMSGWRAGSVPVQRTRRLESIDIQIRNQSVRRYHLLYDETYANTSRLNVLRECVASTCKPDTEFEYYEESGFAEPVIAGTQLRKGNGAHARAWPVGNIVPRDTGDFLNTNFQNSRYTWLQPIPDSVAIAVNFVPSYGHILGATANALNVLGGFWALEAGELYSMTFNPLYSTLVFEEETCEGNPTDQLLFHPAGVFGGAELHRQCLARTPTHAPYTTANGSINGTQDVAYMRQNWFIDVDGDGVQDKVFCSDPEFIEDPEAPIVCGPAWPLPPCQPVAYQAEPQLHYALARSWNNPPRIPVAADEESAHGTIPRAFESLCRLDVDDCNLSAPTPASRPRVCTAERPFSMAFDVDGDGTSNLIVYDSERQGGQLGWAVLFFDQGAGPGVTLQPRWDPSWFEGININPNDYHLETIDTNGDGLRDILALPTPQVGGPARLLLNTGTKFSQRIIWSAGASDDLLAPSHQPFPVDLDHDGKEELLEPHPDVDLTERLPWRVRRISGNGSPTLSVEEVESLVGGPGILADFDADGNLDILTSASPEFGNSFYFHRGSGRRHHLLKATTNGLGHRIEVEYDLNSSDGYESVNEVYSTYYASRFFFPDNRPHCEWPCRESRPYHPLVSSHKNGHYRDLWRTDLAEDQVTHYRYAGGQYDVAGYGWLGFRQRQISVWDSQGEFLSEMATLFKTPNPWTELGSAPYQYVTTGLPERVFESAADESQGLEMALATDTLLDWETKASAAGRPFPFLRDRVVDTIVDGRTASSHGETANPMTRRYESYEADGYGNVTDLTVATYDLVGSSHPGTLVTDSVSVETIHRTYYPPNTATWLVGLLDTETVESSPRCDTIINCEDAERTRTSRFTYDDSNGLVHFAYRLGALGETRRTEYTRDTYGNAWAMTTEAGTSVRKTTITFDDRGLFPVAVRQFGESTNHATQVRYDDRFGVLTVRVDPNGIDETWTYDDLGVLRHHRGPGREITRSYVQADRYVAPNNWVIQRAYQVTTNEIGGTSSVREFNSFGQAVREHVRGHNGAWISQEFEYDHRQRLAMAEHPHLQSVGTSNPTTYQYDDADRTILESGPGGRDVEYEYGVFAGLPPTVVGAKFFSLVRDPLQNETFSEMNRDGAPLKVTDALGKGTIYTYGAFGDVETITAPSGARLAFTRDDYGRTTSIDDPARGLVRATYNGLDEVVQTDDALVRPRKYGYDDFGRLRQIEEEDLTVSTWSYDGDGSRPNEIGRLIGSVSSSGQQRVYRYEPPTNGNNRGFLQAVTERLLKVGANPAAGDYVELTTSYAYSPEGRLVGITYPENAGQVLSVQYLLDPATGEPVRAYDGNNPSRVFWELTETERGYLPKVEKVGTADCGGTNTPIETVRTYDPESDELLSIVTKKCGTTKLQELEYTYDDAGNVESRTDLLVDRTEVFGYDPLNRLVSTNGNQTHWYDPDHYRLTEQTGVGVYSYSSTAGRDWIANVGGPSTGTSYTHDAVGNVATRTAGGVTQTIQYTTFDLPSSITPSTGTATMFRYDADNQRRVKQTGSLATLYAGDHFQRIEDGSGVVRGRAVIYAGGRAVAQMNSGEPNGSGGTAPPTFRSLHDDHLGSTQVIAGSDGVVQGTRDYAPFGQQREAGGLEAEVPTGFTGHETDADLGLINMRGRMFDPKMGQFLSPDPILTQPYGQGLNRYAYVQNSPLNYTDPSGFSPACGRFCDSIPVIGVTMWSAGVLTAVAGNLAAGPRALGGAGTFSSAGEASVGGHLEQAAGSFYNITQTVKNAQLRYEQGPRQHGRSGRMGTRAAASRGVGTGGPPANVLDSGARAAPIVADNAGSTGPFGRGKIVPGEPITDPFVRQEAWKMWTRSNPNTPQAHEEGLTFKARFHNYNRTFSPPERWEPGSTLEESRRTGKFRVAARPPLQHGKTRQFLLIHSHPWKEHTLLFTENGVRMRAGEGPSDTDAYGVDLDRINGHNVLDYVLTPEGIYRVMGGQNVKWIAPLSYLRQ